MKKQKWMLLTVSVLVWMCTTNAGFAQKQNSGELSTPITMREAFTTLPDSLMPLLTKNNRMDMMDFIDNHMEARVENRLGTQSRMDTLTTDYLKVRLTDNSTVEMKLLPLEDGTELIGVIHTVKGPALDSSIDFYTSAWQSAEVSDYYTQPSLERFVNKAELSEEEQQALADLDLQMMVLAFSASDTSLTVRRSVGQLPRETRVKAEKVLQPIVLKWSGKQFK